MISGMPRSYLIKMISEVYHTITTPPISVDVSDIKKFRKFIQNFLAFTVTQKHDPRSDMTTPEFMRYWIDAFTHDSIDARHNYQVLEFLGDGDLKAAFKQYLYRFHNVESGHVFTTVNSNYMSENKQPEIAKRLHIDKWIRVDPLIGVSDKIIEDVLESTFGVLSVVGRKLYLSDKSKYLHPQELIVRFFEVYFSVNMIDPKREGIYVWKSNLIDFWKLFTGEVNQPRGVDKDSLSRLLLTSSFYNGIVNYSDTFQQGQEIVREIKSLNLNGLSEAEQARLIMEIFINHGMNKEWHVKTGREHSFKGDVEIEELAKKNKYSRFAINPYFYKSVKHYKLVGQRIDARKRTQEDEIMVTTNANFKDQFREILIRKFR